MLLLNKSNKIPNRDLYIIELINNTKSVNIY